jgi:hypothetical protein
LSLVANRFMARLNREGGLRSRQRATAFSRALPRNVFFQSPVDDAADASEAGRRRPRQQRR